MSESLKIEMSSPQISVIIPNYNGSKYLREAIDSALGQKGAIVEVIVVDDGSLDNSVDILESYGDKIRTFYQKNKGASAARNLGWRNARAEYIKFLDADDVLLPGVLKLQLEHIEKLYENEISYGQAIWTDEQLNPMEGYPVKPIKPGQDLVHHILTQNPLTTTPLHKKNLLQSVDGFDIKVKKGQEYDLHLRLVLKGVKFCFTPYPIYKFRQHSYEKRFSLKPISSIKNELFETLSKQYELINQYYGENIPQAILDVLAKKFWMYGRTLYQESSFQDAKRFFYASMDLSPNNPDERKWYKLLSRVIGRMNVEALVVSLKAIRHL
ncbi:MAG: glycosyltransferase [Cyclobacteriaceae bacterium]